MNLVDLHDKAHDRAELVVLGFWVFLMSDLIIFGLMFATYITMFQHTADGPDPKSVFDLNSVFVQTMALLLSSLTFGFSTVAMRHQQSKIKIFFWLCVTLALGIVFLTSEFRDFAQMFSQGASPTRSGFLSAFFGLVPLHGLHVTVGCLWIILMMVQMLVLGMIPVVKTRLLRLGLFWHFLDIIWVGIFSIVYLAGLLI